MGQQVHERPVGRPDSLVGELGDLGSGEEATTLIVSLGILTEPVQLGVLMLGVVLLVLQGFATNRLAGLDYPVWSPRRP